MLDATNIPKPEKGNPQTEDYPDIGHVKLYPREKDSKTYMIGLNSKAASMLGLDWRPDGVHTVAIVRDYSAKYPLAIGRTDEKSINTVDSLGRSVTFRPGVVSQGSLNFRSLPIYDLVIGEATAIDGSITEDDVYDNGLDLFLHENIHSDVYELKLEVPEEEFKDLEVDQETLEVTITDEKGKTVEEIPDRNDLQEETDKTEEENELRSDVEW